VWLRRKAGVDLHAGKAAAGGDILGDKFVDKVLAGGRPRGRGRAVDPFVSHGGPSCFFGITSLVYTTEHKGCKAFPLDAQDQKRDWSGETGAPWGSRRLRRRPP